MTSKAHQIIIEALAVTPEIIETGLSIGDTPQWDSLAHFRLVLSIEEHLNRKLDPMEIIGLVDVSSVEALIDK